MKIVGHLDLCGPSLIEGWLYCDAPLDEALRLQVFVGSELLGECIVDRFRQDVLEAGYGDGNCGFSFSVPMDRLVEGFANTRLRLVNSVVYVLPDETTAIAGDGTNGYSMVTNVVDDVGTGAIMEAAGNVVADRKTETSVRRGGAIFRG